MEIPLKQPTETFSIHLGVPDNNRIIFSGSFGSGKTYFLKKYFEKNSRYNTIHLFPINYSISSNEDIFELIKYDLLFKILEKGINFEKVKIPYSLSLYNFAKKNTHNILSPFLNAIPIIGQGLKNIYDDLYHLAIKLNEQYEIDQINQETEILDYLKSFSQKRGSLTENDFYTDLIINCVGNLKEGSLSDSLETILIIDDLDRIDPDHIFRIFNVLAAHVDFETGTNKFNFDKIILVCDISNIKNIFNNRYGSNVDFLGYVEKFYSKEIYHFSLSNEMGGRSREINSLIFDKSIEIDDLLKLEISFVLENFIRSNQLNVRSISKVIYKQYSYTSAYKWPRGWYRRSISNVSFFTLFDVLKWVFGDIEKILIACQNTRTPPVLMDDGNDINKFYLENLLPILAYDQHMMIPGSNNSFQLDIDSYRIYYKVDINPETQEGDESKIYVAKFSIEKVTRDNNLGNSLYINEVDYFKLLYATIIKGQQLKILT